MTQKYYTIEFSKEVDIKKVSISIEKLNEGDYEIILPNDSAGNGLADKIDISVNADKLGEYVKPKREDSNDKEPEESGYKVEVKYGDSNESIGTWYLVKDSSGKPEKEDETPLAKFIKENLLIIVLVGIIVILIAVIVALLILRSRRNKRPSRKIDSYHERKIISQGDVSADAQTIILSRPGYPQNQRRVSEDNTKRIQIEIFGRNHRVVNLSINGSAFVGRSDKCELFINDASVSRQHFVFECLNGEIYIQPLADAMNGTKLNDDVLIGKKKLMQGDQIIIGRVGMVVRW